jgi:hypothetical protein
MSAIVRLQLATLARFLMLKVYNSQSQYKVDTDVDGIRDSWWLLREPDVTLVRRRAVSTPAAHRCGSTKT